MTPRPGNVPRQCWKDSQALRKEIPSDREGFRHFEISLKVEGSENTVFLARLRKYTGSEKYVGNGGFDESTLAFEWLQVDRLLHVSWRTCPEGQGTNTMQTHLLLLKQHNSWQQLYRDSQPFYAKGGLLIRYWFRFQPESDALVIQEDDYSPLIRGEYRARVDDSTQQDTSALALSKATYLCEWRFKLTEGTLRYLDGTRSINLNERTWDLYRPMLEEQQKREYDIHVLAKFLDSNNENKMLDRLKKLNPILRNSDVCSGLIVFESGINRRTPDESVYYGIPE